MIIAGETSGDKHAALLAESLQKAADVRLYGVGGDRMKEAGVALMHHVREMSVMGFSEVLFRIPFLRRVSRELIESIDARKPDGVILVDYPGFNLRFAALARARGLKVIYFISPQVWAWGKGRIEKIRRTVDLMLTVFKFEEEMYKEEGIDAHWVGHPLVDEITHPDSSSFSEFKKKYGIAEGSKILALLPGSRLQEIRRILPGMLRTAELLAGGLPHETIKIVTVIGCAPGIGSKIYDELTAGSRAYPLLCPDVESLLISSDAGIIASGTATLEAALYGLPIAVVYKTGWLNYLIGRSLVKLKSISLVNIVAGKEIVKEFVQGNFKPGEVAEAVREMLVAGGVAEKMRNEYKEVRRILGEKGATDRAAKLILNSI